MRRRRVLVAIGLSTALSLLAAEVALRAFAPRRTYEVLTNTYPAMFEPSEVMPYRLRKNYSGRLANVDFDTSIHINSRGHRGAEFIDAKGDRRRLLVIGDSFTFGWGVNDDDTYPAQLQKRLNSLTPDSNVEVVNAGFAAGYSPDTYYLYLKNEGLALEPDAIVVSLFIGNDFDSDAAFENEWVQTDARGLPLSIRNRNSRVVDNYLVPWPIPVRYRTPVLSRLHVYQGLFDIWWEISPRLKSWMFMSTTVYADEQGSVEDQVPYNYRLRYADRTETVFKRVTTLLHAMQQLAAEGDVPLFVMVIPEPSQLNEGSYAGLPVDLEKPQKQLRTFFDARGLKHLDLLPVLRKQRSAGTVVYFPNDGHFTSDGNRLAAESLSDFLAREWLQE